MSAPPSKLWSKEDKNTLRTLWAEGLSCLQISKRIPGKTPDAIAGKRKRLGLPPRGSPIKYRAEPTPEAKLKLKPGGVKKISGWQPRKPVEPPSRGCLWISGNPSADFTYCGNPRGTRSDGSLSPYCPEHHKRAHVPRGTVPWGQKDFT